MSLVLALLVIVMATSDVAVVFQALMGRVTVSGLEGADAVVSMVIEIVDSYLLASALLILSMGLYMVFFGTIGPLPKNRTQLMVIETLDDLKARLTKAILLVLLVKFFKFAMKSHVENPLDLAWFGLGVLLFAGALLISHLADLRFNRQVEKP